jgi:hypothetical protein
MNYIKQLKLERDATMAQLEGLKEGITDLLIYLDSDKFRQDESVNRNDVIMRIQEAYSYSTCKFFEVHNANS